MEVPRYVWLVAQDVRRLFGKYLTEAVIVAATKQAAVKSTMAVAKAFDLTVRKSRLTVTKLGPLTATLASHQYRWDNVLSVGEASDETGVGW